MPLIQLTVYVDDDGDDDTTMFFLSYQYLNGVIVIISENCIAQM